MMNNNHNQNQNVNVNVEHCKKANMNGLHYYLNGKYDIAATNFGYALRHARELMSFYENQRQQQQEQVATNPTEATAETGPIHSSSNNIIMPVSSSPLVVPTTTTTNNQDEAAEAFGVYKLPLLINEYAMINNNDDALELSLSIMFNIALSTHLHGLSLSSSHDTEHDEDRNSNKDFFLSRAMSLYEGTYTLLTQQVQQQQEQQQESSEERNTLRESISTELTMAIINNLGQIHTVLGDQETATKCYNQLLSTMVLLQFYYGNDNDDNMETDDNNNNNNNKTRRSCWKSCCNNEIFIQSVSHLILKDNVASAA